MRAGKLRHLVKFERRELTANDYGEQSESYVEVKTVRAAVDFGSASQDESGGLETLGQTIQILIRYRTDLDSSLYASFNGVRYRVLALIPDPKRTQLTITARVEQ